MSSLNTPIDFCPHCKNEIDAEICWCGGYMKNHSVYDGHTPVYMGCTCGYITEKEEKYISKTLAEKYPETHKI